MKQLLFYKYAMIALLILNIAMLSFFFLTKPPHLKNHIAKPLRMGQEILKLNEEDKAVFLQLANVHHQEMQAVNKQQRELLNPYFSSIIDSTITNKDELLTQLQSLERKKLELTYQHFEELKSRLKSVETADYEKFMEMSLQFILSKNRPPRPRRH